MQSGVYILADSSLHIVIALGVCDPSLMQRVCNAETGAIHQ